MSHLQQSLGLQWLSLKGYKNTRSSLLYPFYQKKKKGKRIIGHNATESQSNQIPLKKKKQHPAGVELSIPFMPLDQNSSERKPFSQIILLLNSVVGLH